MKSIYKLVVLADKFEKTDSEQGEYGGRGPFTLPANHVALMQVSRGGSSCSTCRFVDAENHACKNKYYILWNGGDNKLPTLPLDEICSDWWQPK